MKAKQPLAPTLAFTPRQQAIIDLLAEHRDGITADEAGRKAHTVPGPRGGRVHSGDETCEFCAKEGRRLLDQLVELGAVVRRRGGGSYRYVPADGLLPPERHGTEGREGFDDDGLPIGF